MYSEESRVVRAAHKEEFGADGGYVGDRPAAPVSCYAAAAKAAAVGIAAAFVTGAALVGVAHHFGGSGNFDQVESADIDGSDSVQDLLDARADALSIA